MTKGNNNICSLNGVTNDRSTCLPESVINKEYFQEYNDDDNISIEQKIKKLSEKRECVLDDINKNELCIIKKSKNSDNIKNIIKYFKPVAGKLTYDYWINNTEIDNVQYQFSLNFKGYYYSYIHMIDFGMFSPQNAEYMDIHKHLKSIKEIDWVKEVKALLSNNINDNKDITFNYNGPIRGFGVVVNTDFTQGNGIHWFAIYINFDLKNNNITIEYFNSSGYPIKERDFRTYWIDVASKIKLETEIESTFIQVTNITHQSSKTSNCGAYALYYIWSRIKDNPLPIEHFAKNKIYDKDMEEFRSFIFRKKN